MFYLIYLNRNDVSSKQHHKSLVSCEIEAYLVLRYLVDGGSSTNLVSFLRENNCF
jgi:hypothetical protein